MKAGIHFEQESELVEEDFTCRRCLLPPLFQLAMSLLSRRQKLVALMVTDLLNSSYAIRTIAAAKLCRARALFSRRGLSTQRHDGLKRPSLTMSARPGVVLVWPPLRQWLMADGDTPCFFAVTSTERSPLMTSLAARALESRGDASSPGGPHRCCRVAVAKGEMAVFAPHETAPHDAPK